MEKEDKELIKEFIAGNPKSLEIVIDRYLKPIFNYVYRITNERNETEDIVQEIFIKVWKNIRKFDQKQNFKTWIFTITRNTAIDWLRKRKNVVFSELDPKTDSDDERSFAEKILDIEPLPDEIFMRKELEKELENALLKIKPNFREIIFLRYKEDLTFQEIAEIVDKPLNTVKSQWRRALQNLRKIIIEEKRI